MRQQIGFHGVIAVAVQQRDHIVYLSPIIDLSEFVKP
jgi:hypothetical protein